MAKNLNIYIYIIIIFIIIFILLCIYIYIKVKDTFENETITTMYNEPSTTISNETNKIAFLFLTYNNLKRADIWMKFFNIKNDENDITKSQYYNKFTIYNHAKDKEQVTDILLKDRHIPEHIETGWGQFNLVEANILMMKQALLDPLNKKFILVSDSCIPIVSFDTFYNEIMSDDKSRINIFHNNNPERYVQIINPPFPKDELTKHSGSGLVLNLNHAKILTLQIEDLHKNWKAVSCLDEHYFGNILRITDKDFSINNNSIKNTFDIWSKDKLDINYLCNNKKNDETICTYTNRGLSSPDTINKISNKMIDILRNKQFVLLRKINDKTEIDIEYLLN